MYIVDSFTNRLFAGKPAAVCPPNDWLDDVLLQSIAAENNLSETAFYVCAGEDVKIAGEAVTYSEGLIELANVD